MNPSTRRATVAAVIRNPFVGAFKEDLSAMSDIGEELGALLPARAIAALGISGNQVESFGKAALVGEDGELEHAAAILHPKLGAPFRKALGGGAALIPSSKKRGGIGAPVRRTAGPQGCGPRPQPFRWRRGACPGRSAGRRDRDRDRNHGLGAAASACGGLTKDQIEGRDGVR